VHAFIEANQPGANLGYSVASAGDLNADGYSDVIVGAPFYSNGESGEGAAFVFFGSASGLSDGTPASADVQIESHQVGALLGRSVASAGDVNGDGHSDVIVGATNYSSGETAGGAAFVFLGSASEIPDGSPANAHAQFESNQLGAALGQSVASAGDVNGDGYSDVIVGAYLYSNGESWEGAAFVFLGSPAGLVDGSPANAHARLESDQINAFFGVSVASAGDVNGDGYSDVVVGAPFFDGVGDEEGAAFLFLGSPVGLAHGTPANAHARLRSNQAGTFLGVSVASVGDVNGDGNSDVIVGAHRHDDGETDEGAGFVFLGSPNGIGNGNTNSAHAQLSSNQSNALLGWSVASAGDVNDDGFSDVIVGATGHSNGESGEGAAFVFLGNTEPGRVLHLRQLRADGSGIPIQSGGLAQVAEAFRVSLSTTSARGRERGKLEVEVCPFDLPFESPACLVQSSPTWIDLGTAGVTFTETISGLTPHSLYDWRARILYAPMASTQPGITPNIEAGPWRRIQRGVSPGDVRVPEPGIGVGLAAGVGWVSGLRRRSRVRGAVRQTRIGRLAFFCLVLLSGVLPGLPARATFPGAIGLIAFDSSRDGNHEIYTMTPGGTLPTRLTTNPAADVDPVWSPDGTRIAFESDRDGNPEIYVMNADGTGPTRLTNNPASDTQPCWSPDGSRIVFTSLRDGNFEIYVMNADGTSQTNLSQNAASDGDPAWSPDGTRIAFYSTRISLFNAEIYVMQADGSSPTRITFQSAADLNPSWSPDSNKIAFRSDRDGNAEIYWTDAAGASLFRLTNNAAFDQRPVWSPDGLEVAFVSSRDGNDEVYRVGLFGGSAIRLTFASGTEGGPDWQRLPPYPAQPTEELVFANEDWAIWIMYSDGSSQRPLASIPGLDLLQPAWSPDGTRIAVTTAVGIDLEVGIVSGDGSGLIELTDHAAQDAQPDWSPDGTRIVFASERDGNPEIYVMNADGTGQTRLTRDPAADLWPDWSPDGKQIVFASGNGSNRELYLMAADGTGRTLLTLDPATESQPDWSPDGSQIVFTATDAFGRDSLRRIDADGSGMVTLLNSSGGSPAWSPDGTRIAFSCFPVCFVDSDGSNLDELSGVLGGQRGLSPAWRPVPESGLGLGLALGVLGLGGVARRR
jgi:Tol biopolymer transport system component